HALPFKGEADFPLSESGIFVLQLVHQLAGLLELAHILVAQASQIASFGDAARLTRLAALARQSLIATRSVRSRLLRLLPQLGDFAGELLDLLPQLAGARAFVGELLRLSVTRMVSAGEGLSCLLERPGEILLGFRRLSHLIFEPRRIGLRATGLAGS